MIVINFPIMFGREGIEFDRQVYRFIDSLPKLPGGHEPVTMEFDSEQLVFYRDEDAIAFRLKFGL